MFASSETTARRSRRVSIAVCLSLGLAIAVATPLPAMAAPTIGGTDTITYNEQDPATPISGNLTLTGGTGYCGEYLQFEVTSSASTETLALIDDGVASTDAGVVSVVGTNVYLGNGTTADIIGSVDGTLDGTGGSALRINFTSDFQNSGFETGDFTGWTTLDQRIDLGVTDIAGCTTVDTSTYPGPTPNEDNNAPASIYQIDTSVVTASGGFAPSEGTYAASLGPTNMTTLLGYDVVHGPAIYSSPFEASAGDTIYFDWRAYAGSDDYHVFGYIIDESCNQTELLDATGPGTTAWATVPTVIPTSGTYRFVFVSGTFDASGGRAAGASLYIDNVQVFGNKVTDAVAQAVARKVAYQNSSDNPPASRTVTVTAQSAAAGSGTGSITINIVPEDDPPTLDTPATIAYTNTIADEDFSESTGTLSAADPEGDGISFEIVGGGAYAGVDYDQSIVGTYGTLYLDTTDGDYRFVPDDDAVNARTSDDSESFTLSAYNSAGSDEASYIVEVDVPASVPGAPTSLDAAAGDGEVDLSWIVPAWLGGSPVTDYSIQYSDDGGSSWSTFSDGVSPATSGTVTGLTNGTEYTFRVAAVNTTGTGGWSATATATPLGQQAALVLSASDFTYASTTSLSVTGGSGSGVVTFDVVSGPCQVTGTTVSASAVGSCDVTATKAGDGVYEAATSNQVTVEISRLELTVDGAGVDTKIYDGTTAATIHGATLVGVVAGDDVSLADATTGVFADPAVGEDIDVVPDMSLSGADAVNYSLTIPVLRGDIVPAPALSVSSPETGDYDPEDSVEARVCDMEPGSDVSVYLDGHSTWLGEWVVGDDGCVSIVAVLSLSATAGDHVLLFEGTDLTGRDVVLSASIEVAATDASLAMTGYEFEGGMWVVVLLVEVGLIAIGLNKFDSRLVARFRRG